MHSQFEQWALVFFVLLVAFEIIVHAFGDRRGPAWSFTTPEDLFGKRIHLPKLTSEVQPKRVCEVLMLLTFATAIGLEVVGYWYGERNDEFADETARTFSQKLASSLQAAAEATALSKSFEAQVAESYAMARAADERTSENSKEAAALRVRATELEKSFEPRDLTPDNRNLLVASLSQFKGQRLIVRSYMFDLEAWRFASAIIATLRIAGISVDDRRNTVRVPANTFIMGIAVTGPESSKDFMAALRIVSLADIFDQKAIEGADSVELMVGVKTWLEPPGSIRVSVVE